MLPQSKAHARKNVHASAVSPLPPPSIDPPDELFHV